MTTNSSTTVKSDEVKHTPGEKFRGYDNACHICGTCWDGKPAGCCPAHVAARDLLEACKGLLDNWNPPGCADKECRVCRNNKAVVDAAKAAIAKAEGKVL